MSGKGDDDTSIQALGYICECSHHHPTLHRIPVGSVCPDKNHGVEGREPGEVFYNFRSRPDSTPRRVQQTGQQTGRAKLQSRQLQRALGRCKRIITTTHGEIRTMIYNYKGTILVSAALWCGLLLALLIQGCGGSGGDSSTPERSQGQEVAQNTATTAPATPSNSNETTNCYFDETTGVNLGEVGDTTTEEVVAERLRKAINVNVMACNSTVTVNADGSVTTTTTTSNTTTTNPAPEVN